MTIVPALDKPDRKHGLDLIKWIALITMVIDHLRLVWPELAITFIPGRISFPFFCLAIAANVARTTPRRMITPSSARYVAFMVFFSLISEPPYRWFYDSQTLNVFPSLTLGLLVALGFHQRSHAGAVLAVAALTIGLIYQQSLMYGVYGLLLPAAFTIAVTKPAHPALAILPALLCVLMNSRHGALGRMLDLDGYAAATLLTAFLSAFLGLWMLRRPWEVRLWKVTQWGYWFYPGHMLALQLLRVDG
ncbi:TraX family protein [Pseudomonas sp. LS-2]|jgi:hypothetical protein|uniref:TraX family protein n=1 Tax=Pseudomonas sp. LS-2 TaxID=2315859 RepID=UPI000E7216A0|nr:TraX family protein [Pseudomonas sp. LS-2]RJX83396.1 conjugal transfer protein TraX [Pseudomonas sp. LS-2]